MTDFSYFLFAAILLTTVTLVVSSRLLSCIKIIAIQGILIGLLPLAVWSGPPLSQPLSLWITSGVNLTIKGILLPALLAYAMRKVNVRRELEPLVSYSTSVSILLALTGVAFLISHRYLDTASALTALAIPTALATLSGGLLMIIARRKALTQVIGFLTFENGITIMGTGMMLEYGLLVELGILLDVLVLVLIMGITIFQINREFAHIDADRLNRLSDVIPQHEGPRS